MKPLAALAISVAMLFAQNDRAPPHSVTAIRNWSLPDVTRIAIEVSGDFRFKTDRLHNPERVYFDILNARPHIDAQTALVQARSTTIWCSACAWPKPIPGTTRVVLDLAGPVEVTTSQLSNPNRLIVELRAGRRPTIPTEGCRCQPASKLPPAIRAEIPKPDSSRQPSRGSRPRPIGASRASNADVPKADMRSRRR